MVEPLKVIDVELWDRAGWKGVVFVTGMGSIPVVGLVFTAPKAGMEIFTRWKRLIGGEDDTRNVIRVAFFEGDIPGEPVGYSATVGVDHDRLLAEPKKVDIEALYFFTRIQRMASHDCAHLKGFKKEFSLRGAYSLVAARLSTTGEPQLSPDHCITKRQVVFRQLADIGPDDYDRVVFTKDLDSRRH